VPGHQDRVFAPQQLTDIPSELANRSGLHR
jgi:hypothetical protein